MVTASEEHAPRGGQDEPAVPTALLDPGQARTHTDGIELPTVAEVKSPHHGSLTWSTGPNPQFDYQAAGTGSGAAYRSSKTALDALTVFYAQALADDGFKVNALAPGLRATNLNPRAATPGGDPAEAAAGGVRLALLPDDGPTGQLFSWDGTVVPW